MGKDIQKISFIGHSLGGIVIRASLPFLKNLKSKMTTYISLSSPHLGCKENDSFIINFGLKVLKSIKSSTTLK